MLHFDEILKVMKEKSFYSEFKKMVDDAANQLKAQCIIPEEDLENLHQVTFFSFTYDFEKNTIKVFAASDDPGSDYEKVIILDSELETMKLLSNFLENKYTKKLAFFELDFIQDDEVECKTSIFVVQKKVTEEVLYDYDKYCTDQEEYFDNMSQRLKSDFQRIGIEYTDLAKEDEWRPEFIVE